MPVRDYQMKWCMTEEDLKTRFQEVVHDPAVDASTYYSGNRLKAENHALPSAKGTGWVSRCCKRSGRYTKYFMEVSHFH